MLKSLSNELGGEEKDEPEVAILTVKGVGIRSHTGVGLRMFKALAEARSTSKWSAPAKSA